MLTLTKANALSLHLKQKLEPFSINKLAIEIGFIKRKPKKIDPLNLLVSQFVLSLTNGNSLSAIAEALGLIKNTRVSKQAIDKRINPIWVEFLKTILAKILSQCVHTRKRLSDCSVGLIFKRILIQDSTHISLGSKLALYYPGSKNGTGKSKAIMKIQSVYNVLTECFLQFDISPFTKNDQCASQDIVNLIQPGDLIIRDLGYFVLSVLKKINNASAYFLSRLKYCVDIFEADGITPFDLSNRLKDNAYLDTNVCLGKKEKFPVRIVTVPVPDEIAAERRRKSKKNRDRRLCPSKEHLFLLGWNIFITNATSKILSVNQISLLYKLRWRIEIVFKSWKSHFHITNVPKASLVRVQAYIYAILIFITIFQTHVFIRLYNKLFRRNQNQLSLFKMTKFFKEQIWAIIFFFLKPKRLEEQIFYHCSYVTRKNKSTYPQLVMELS